MKTKTIDLNAVASSDDLHDAFATAMEFPDYYGRNMDALWDCLNDYHPERLELKSWSPFSQRLPKLAAQINEILRELADSDPAFSYELF